MKLKLQDIEALVKQGESNTLEFKKSTGQLKSAFETACAFLNGSGGTILFGVTDNGNIVGQEVSDKTKREISSELVKIYPVALIDIYYVDFSNEKQIIICQIEADLAKQPYTYDRRAFMRNQSSTWLMPLEYQQQLTLNNAPSGHRWEDHTLKDITLNDLDTDEILNTIREGVANGRIDTFTDDPWTALTGLKLIENQQITNAALVLFGKHPENKYPQCLLRLARFRGIDNSDFIDNKQVSGNVFKLLSTALAFANTYLPVGSTFPENSLERVDTPLFPMMALREALANAFCHRDYTQRNTSISFAIYDDRLEIWNPGLLPHGISTEEIKHLNRSIPRNLRIASPLYFHKIFESWGRGVEKIVNLCKAAGHPEPFYKQEAGGTVLVMPSYQLIGNTRAIPSVQKSSVKLGPKQQQIMQLLKTHRHLSPSDLNRLIATDLHGSMSVSTINRELKRLQELGLVDCTGETRARQWHIIT